MAIRNAGASGRLADWRRGLAALLATWFCLLWAVSASATNPSESVVWARNYGATGGNGTVHHTRLDSSGNVYIAGTFFSSITFGTTTLTAGGTTDGFVGKLDRTGTLLWVKRIGGASGTTKPQGLAVDSSGNVYVSGTMDAALTSPATLALLGTNDGFALKLDTSGNTTWLRGFGGAGANTDGSGIAVTGSGDIYVTGTFGNANLTSPAVTKIGTNDIYTSKLDSSGTVLWTQNMGGAFSIMQPTGIAVDSSDNAYISGYMRGGNPTTPALTVLGDNDALVVKYNSSGTIVWANNYGGNNAGAQARSIAFAANKVLVSGSFFNASMTTPNLARVGYIDAFLMQIDPSTGNVNWAKNYSGATADAETFGVAGDSMGNVYMSGYFTNANLSSLPLTRLGSQDAYLLKTDSAGNTEWSVNFGGPNAYVEGRGIAVDDTGTVYMGGNLSGITGANMTSPALTKIGFGDAIVIRYGPPPPTSISSITVPQTGRYGLGTTLDFVVTTSAAVNFTGGSPTLNLTIGNSTAHAAYVSGDGTSTLNFTYTVQAGDNDLDGIALNSMDLGNAVVRDAFLVDLDRTLPSINSMANVLIDTDRPILSNVYAATPFPNPHSSLFATSSEEARGYWVAFEPGSNAPSVADIRAGVAAGMLAAGSGQLPVGAGELVLHSLQAGKTYDLYLVAEDPSGNITLTASTATITRAMITDPPTPQPVTTIDLPTGGGSAIVKNGDKVVVTSNDQGGSTLSMSTPGTVTVSVNGKSFQLNSSGGAVELKFDTVNVGGVSTPVIRSVTGDVVLTTGPNTPLLAAAGQPLSSCANVSTTTLKVMATGADGSRSVEVVSGCLTLPAGVLANSNHFASLQDNRLLAGEAFFIDPQDKLGRVRLGTAGDNTDQLGDRLPLEAINRNAGLTDLKSPRLDGVPVRLGNGPSLRERLLAANRIEGAATNQYGVISAKGPDALLSRANYRVVGDVLLSTDASDAGVFLADGRYRHSVGGYQLVVAPSVPEPYRVLTQLRLLVGDASAVMQPSGAYRVSVGGGLSAGGSEYVLRPSWYGYDSNAVGISGWGSDDVRYHDGSQSVPLRPAVADMTAVTQAVLGEDGQGSINTDAHSGLVYVVLHGAQLRLLPVARLEAASSEHAGRAWWVDAQQRVVIRNRDQTIQAFQIVP